MVRGKIIKSKVLMRVWACLAACLVLVCSAPVRVEASISSETFPSFYNESIYSNTVGTFTKNYKFNVGADGIFINDSSVNISYATGVADFKFDIGYIVSGSQPVTTSQAFDYLLFYMAPDFQSSLNYTSNGFDTFMNCIFTVRPYVVLNGEKYYLSNKQPNYIKVDSVPDYLSFNLGAEVEAVCSFDAKSTSADVLKTLFGTIDVQIISNGTHFNIYGVRYVSTGEQGIIDALGGVDTKVEIQIEKSEEEIALQEQQNQLQEQANELQEENNKTQKNIFEKIVDFFDNFFSRLGDFLLHIIVPSAEELTAFLDEVNEWFGERLGFLWFPFSFAIEIVQVFASGEADSMFRVPGFSLNIQGTEYQIWNELTVDMDAFGIFKYVRFFTSALLIGGVVKLAVNKWDAWIGGRSAS